MSNPLPPVFESASMPAPPVILAFAPHDPSGRGGLQAVVETVACLGGHCTAVATGLFASGSDAAELVPTPSHLLIQQARSILEDMPVSTIVIGYAGSITNLEAIHSILEDYPQIPVVCMSGLKEWENSSDEGEASHYPQAFAGLISPKSRLLICANDYADELASNAPMSEASIHRLSACAGEYLLTYQCKSSARCFEYVLYDEETVLAATHWQAAHCAPSDAAVEVTVAAAVATFIGHESSMEVAVQEALSFAQQSANSARRIGFEALIPNRFFWVNNAKD